ncbi:hypothetical protein ACFPZ0_16585 [Streptomonospora nanhaiensis]|uniref:Uncharacterized protein n=1 Tax=Streptomonospora nanhaiensis TaxID=1323731 RepID=A0A853BTS2_9ACTN|nr:hypothetical protein [Streptomonospora nanhaiensis]MBV2366061.1 hypothetical protein [Streptomonospora nanhaiensis]MBX9389754.1 hypothetical protein [Streptomonospora nanhaiensis]NYI97682.1 hypothetical protein [Streptomonospora nanhaiensis]
MKSSLRRIGLVAAAVPMLALAAPAAASADAMFLDSTTTADHEGAAITVVESITRRDGTVVYRTTTYTAGLGGAHVHVVYSSAL